MRRDYYVYRHIRLDTGNPFYVGKGVGRRAYVKDKSRNFYWKNIVKKVDYRVEIVISGLTHQEALQKEYQLIKVYKGFGLCEANFATDGREVTLVEFEELRRSKISKALKGKKNRNWDLFPATENQKKAARVTCKNVLVHIVKSAEFKARMSARKSKPVIDTATGIIYKSVREAAKHLNMCKTLLGYWLNGTHPNKTTLIYLSEYSAN